jgi:hypothetical protein
LTSLISRINALKDRLLRVQIPCCFDYRLRHRQAMVRQLFDVVHQAEQLPLPIYFLLPAQRESIQAFVMPDIAKYRLDGRKTLTVQTPALVTVDAFFHTLRVRQRRSLVFVKERDLPRLRLIGMAQTLRP